MSSKRGKKEAKAQPSAPGSVNEKMLKDLQTLGYSVGDATEALTITRSKGVDHALGWLGAAGRKPDRSTSVKSSKDNKGKDGGGDGGKGKGKLFSFAARREAESESDWGDDSGDDFGFDSGNESEDGMFGPTTVHEPATPDYRVLSAIEIVGEQKREISEVSELLAISMFQAGTLLRHYKWNKEKVIQLYLESPEKTAKAASMPVTRSPSARSRDSRRRSSKEKFDCDICADEMSYKNTDVMEPCHHRFCNDCWGTYLSKKIGDEGESVDIRCMGYKCVNLMPEQFVRRHVSAKLYEKYTTLLTRSFVSENPNVKWCPAPGCDNAIDVSSVKVLEVACRCGYKFCFGCQREGHAPASCKDLTEWLQKCADDSETANWIKANTSDCPECNVAIEKNGGCNHMTCRTCKHEFCWVCMKPWKEHNNNYSCNRYDEGKAAKQSASRQALERYLFYFHRYTNHEKSRKFESQIRVAAEKKMEEMQNQNKDSWIDVQYIAKAVDALLECRHALKYTYVMAYYMPESPKKALFEYLQQELESNTERLSYFLEAAPIDQLNRLEVVDCTRSAEQRLHNLLKSVEDGLGA